MAGSGWCHHPLRKTTSELLIMVRRNELACRDQWSHSLWEEGVWAPARDAVGHGLDAIDAGRPVPPATESDIAALLRADAKERPVAPLVSAQEDVVLGEARLATDRTPPWRRDEPPVAPRRDTDPKTAIKRAREAYQERLRAQAAERAALVAEAPLATALANGAEPADAPHNEHEAVLPADEPVVQPEGVDDQPVAAVADPLNAIGVVEPAAPVFDVLEDRAEEAGLSVEPLMGEAPANGYVAEETDEDWWTAGAAGPDAPFAEWDEPADGPVPTSDPMDEEPFSHAPAAEREWSPAWFRDDPAPPAAGAVASPWSVASASAGTDATAAGSVAFDDEWEDDAAGVGFERDDAPEHAAAWAEDDPGIRTGATVWPGEGGYEEPEFVPAQPADEPTEAVAAADAAPPERLVIPLLPVGSVAPGVPRICRTCRDYRPAEGGDRGWCANEWAFTNRQMVQPDDPAPCETSAGSWWLPTDDLCLADADVSTHGQPTPYLDKWLPHHREREAERKRS